MASQASPHTLNWPARETTDPVIKRFLRRSAYKVAKGHRETPFGQTNPSDKVCPVQIDTPLQSQTKPKDSKRPL